jgi:LPS O-antigen subunit length determinant protein (WzzB/FepE family)
MHENNINKNLNINDDEIDLRELFHVLLQGKWVIISLTSLASIAVIFFSLSLSNIYESKAILVPTDSSGGISGALSSYSGIASLAGIKLPNQNSKSNSPKAIKKLNTLSFFEKNILPSIFLPNLFAIESWDQDTNKITYDKNIYDLVSKSWVRNNKVNKIPSAQESFRAFQESINISQDNKTSFITLTVKHQSPHIAKKWAELLIKEINAFYREQDKLESQRAVKYLNAQIIMTNLSEIKQVIAQLLQQETQKLTLIEANEAYVFDYIDPPAVMEEKIGPRRSIICIIGSILGAVLGILIVLIRHYLLKE